MQVFEYFKPDAERYLFDFELCTPALGFTQIGSGRDAWHYGNWANPTERVLVEYASGDVKVRAAADDAEFAAAVRETVEILRRRTGRCRIEAAAREDIKTAFEGLGLADLLH